MVPYILWRILELTENFKEETHMPLENAINKARAELGLNGTVHLEAAVTQTEETTTSKTDIWVKNYLAEINSNPEIKRTKLLLVQAAVEKERVEMGFPTRN